MNRTGLLIVIGIGVVAGVILGLYPDIDLAVSRHFYDSTQKSFVMARDPTALAVREWLVYAITAIAAPAFIALAVKLILPRRPMLMPARAVVLLIATLALAPGLVTNVILKDNWGRPRPYSVQQFGGPEPFVPWWDPRGGCDKNCSFVAGEGAGAFWTLAPAAVTPPPWRAVAYAGALAFGTGVGIFRITFGAHFLSDVIFSGVFTFLVIWLAHGLIYRWAATRLTDSQVERAIERIVLPGYEAIARLILRKPGAGEPR
jgi:membrane-associated PAP2 superfamily phosphatase